YATGLTHRISKRRLLSSAFGSGVEKIALEGGSIGPMWHQAPAHRSHLPAAVGALPYHRHVLCRSDVVSRGKGISVYLEQPRQIVFVPVERIASTHLDASTSLPTRDFKRHFATPLR